MSDIKHRDRILEAIDQLRRRKARPDVQRICNFLMRRFSINSNDTKADLQKCVEREIVLRVEYKGNISYRNAAKKYSHLNVKVESVGASPVLFPLNSSNKYHPYQQQQQQQQQHHQHQQHQHHQQQSRRKFNALLTNAITELIVHEPDYLEVGVPGPELIRTILSRDSVRYTKKYLGILLEKEVQNGALIKMENGNYLPGPTKKKESMFVAQEESNKFKYHSALAKEKAERRRDDDDDDVDDEEEDDDRHDRHQRLLVFNKKKDRKKTAVKLGVKKGKMEGDDFEEGKNYRGAENGMLRVGSRRKRAKKVFDPSDNNLPKKRGRPVGSSLTKFIIDKHVTKSDEVDFKPEPFTSTPREQGGVCSVCHNNKKVPNDRLVACRECSNKAHVGCLNGDDMMLKMYPDNTWQCPHCKTCCICYETSDAGYLTVCSVCADAYHASCHEPPVTEKIRAGMKWLCINCQMPEQLQVNEIHPNMSSSHVFTHRETSNDAREKDSVSPALSISDDSNHNSVPPSPTPPTLSPQANQNGNASPEIKCNFSDSQSVKDLDVDDMVDPSIPDATHWSHDDVYNYFVQYFPEEAKVFREQQIDGRSLLLMKRMDVVSSLKLKLGPALKIYRHVVKLQFRRDDPKLYWL